MRAIADKILETIKDYRNDEGIFLDSEHILNWANQFGDDATFILNEVSHIIPQVYVSKEKAKTYIDAHIKNLLKDFNYSDISQFLIDTEFLDLQQSYKSQPAILSILEELLNEKYGESYVKYKTYPKINFVYFDDILASGSTIGNHLVHWLKEKNSEGISNSENVLKDNYKLSINLFGLHNWGQSFQKFRFKKEFEDSIDKKIIWRADYQIQNHAKWNNQSLNVAFPIEVQPTNVKSYLANLDAEKYEDYAYRKPSVPFREKFFTSAANRVRYENILLQKGISIIGMIQSEIKPNIRPLGLINPSYKTFGLGTHFFTWRNIPNNSPLVFWWGVPEHNWTPLFPVGNRG